MEEDFDAFTMSSSIPIPALKTSPSLQYPLNPSAILFDPLSKGSNTTLPYILHLAKTSGSHIVASFSSPADAFGIFDVGNGRIAKVGVIPGHEGGINCLLGDEEVKTKSGIFGSCGQDGIAQFFDIRGMGNGVRFTGKNINFFRAVKLLFYASLQFLSSLRRGRF